MKAYLRIDRDNLSSINVHSQSLILSNEAAWIHIPTHFLHQQGSPKKLFCGKNTANSFWRAPQLGLQKTLPIFETSRSLLGLSMNNEWIMCQTTWLQAPCHQAGKTCAKIKQNILWWLWCPLKKFLIEFKSLLDWSISMHGFLIEHAWILTSQASSWILSGTFLRNTELGWKVALAE